MKVYDIQKCDVIILDNPDHLIIRGRSFCGADIVMRLHVNQVMSLVESLKTAVKITHSEPTDGNPDLN